MKHAGMREPTFGESRCADPGGVIALAAAPKRLVPLPRDLGPKRVEPFDVRGDGVIREVSAHVTQPLALISNGQVSSTRKLVANCDESPHSTHGGVPVKQEPARLVFSQMCVKPRKSNVSGFPLPPTPTLLRRELTEADLPVLAQRGSLRAWGLGSARCLAMFVANVLPSASVNGVGVPVL